MNELKNTILQLSKERCNNPGSFEEFTAQLTKIGVVRQTYDVIKNELSFYSQSEFLLTIAISDIDKSQTAYPFLIGDIFNLEAVKKAIKDFDSGTILSSTEFHKQIALAGIVYVSVYLLPRKIYYLSQDGQYYLESY